MSIVRSILPKSKKSIFTKQFDYIKKSVQNQIKNNKIFENETNKPGHYWIDSLWWSDALFSQNPENIYSTFRFFVNENQSGSPFGDYSQFKDYDQDQIAELPFIKEYLKYIENVPEKYHATEPFFDNEQQWGVYFSGRQLSASVARHQRYISNLYLSGALDHLNKIDNPVIVEIGGGYGLLASLINNMVKKAKYIMIDIPPVLSLAATYLAIIHPGKKQYILNFDKDDFSSINQSIQDSDIIFVPHYSAELLHSLPKIDLAINTFSFQEMAEQNIHHYCNILANKLQGILYSDNFRRHPHNYSLKNKVSDILREYFYVLPHSEDFYTKEIERKINYMWQTYVHIATSKKYPFYYKNKQNYLYGENYIIPV